MTTLRAQVVLKTDDAIVANYSTNSLAFEAVDPPNFTDITAAIKGFYDDLVGYFPTQMAQTGHEVKYYELPGLVPNYPVQVDTWNLSGNPSQTAFPSEVSVCASFQGARISGFPQNRRRGRIYIGPLGSNASGSDARPSATFIGVLVTAVEVFKAAIDAISPAVEWVVWSQTDLESVPIVDGWVDNAWDTQRRRGIQPSARTVWP